MHHHVLVEDLTVIIIFSELDPCVYIHFFFTLTVKLLQMSSLYPRLERFTHDFGMAYRRVIKNIRQTYVKIVIQLLLEREIYDDENKLRHITITTTNDLFRHMNR